MVMLSVSEELLEGVLWGVEPGQKRYVIPAPKDLGIKAPRRPTPTHQLKGKFTLTKDVVRKLRADFLSLMSNTKKVKDQDSAEVFAEAVRRWRAMFEKFYRQIREDLQSRQWRYDLKKKFGETRAQEIGRQAQRWITQMSSLWTFSIELSSVPITYYRLELKLHDGTGYRVTKGGLFDRWAREGRRWEQRARRKAQKVWTWFDEFIDWTLSTGTWGGGGETVQLSRPVGEVVELEGFRIEMRGYDETEHKARLERLKEALRKYRSQAEERAPILLRRQVPMTADFLGDEHQGGDAAAEYLSAGGGHIMIYPWTLVRKDMRAFVKTLAHEMGHHVFKTYLTREKQADWRHMIHAESTPINLVDVLARAREGESIGDLEDRLEREDPVLIMRIRSLHYDNAYGSIWSLSDVKKYLEAGGDPVIRVWSRISTSYSSLNPEEAFCDSLGMYVAYGARTLFPVVLGKLKELLGAGLKEAMEMAMSISGALLEAVAVARGRTKYKVPTPQRVARMATRRQDHEIDTEWVNGIKAWWKGYAVRGKAYKGWAPSGYTYGDKTYKHFGTAREEAKAFLEEVMAGLRDLQGDLLLKKGFYVRDPTTKEALKGASKLKRKVARSQAKVKAPAIKVVNELDDAVKAVEEGLRYIDWIYYDSNPNGNEMNPSGVAGHANIYSSDKDFEFTLKSIGHATAEAIEKADSNIARKLLPHLNRLITKHGDEKTGRYTFAGMSYAPEVVHVGRATLIFRDIPEDPKKRVFFAAVPASRERAGGGFEAEFGAVGATVKGYDLPARRNAIIGRLKEAEAMLKRNKLGFLVYGKMTKRFAGSYDIYYGRDTKKEGHVAATYRRFDDTLDIYDDYVTPRTIVHELGHRYWYKYMSAEDRHNFRRWFGKVPATTEYGGTKPREDFAEVFASFIMREKLTRAQRQRFEQFLGRSRRLESLEDELMGLLEQARGGADGDLEQASAG